MPLHPTNPPAEPDPFEAVRARNRLADQVRAALSGAGLDIRDRTNALVISKPGHPDNGRIYITYATADVSLRRPIWHYLGRLQGHHRDDDPPVDAAAIIAALTSPADTPAETAEVFVQPQEPQQASSGSAQDPEGASL
jgi:hypothetical protein